MFGPKRLPDVDEDALEVEITMTEPPRRPMEEEIAMVLAEEISVVERAEHDDEWTPETGKKKRKTKATKSKVSKSSRSIAIERSVDASHVICMETLIQAWIYGAAEYDASG